jgi:hypothetical protein
MIVDENAKVWYGEIIESIVYWEEMKEFPQWHQYQSIYLQRKLSNKLNGSDEPVPE